MRLFKFLARSALTITLAGVAAKANAQSIDELYQAAKKEGASSLNGDGLAGLYEPWVREFEQRFPGIKVKLTADFSNILAPIIDREIAERKLSELNLKGESVARVSTIPPRSAIGTKPRNPSAINSLRRDFTSLQHCTLVVTTM